MSKSRDQVVFELAALMREAFAEVALSAFKAGQQGLSESQMLSIAVPGCEPLVQSFMRRVVVS